MVPENETATMRPNVSSDRVDGRAANGARRDVARRVLDVAVAGTAVIVLSPVLAAVAIAVRIDSPGPALFRQTRIGKNGRPFTLFKFRSMVAAASAHGQPALAESDRDGICAKWRKDPRVTRVGRLLRKTSIDELPQLVNVLKGDMSLVGPRPALPAEVAAYPDRARGRLAVRPGITGLWQVSGRADIGFDKMIDLDLAYVGSRSVTVDLALIALTVRACLTGRGAY